jgi:exosome complex exonuclease DIS3/RRP44
LKETILSDIHIPLVNVDEQVNAIVAGVLAGLNKKIQQLESENDDLRQHVTKLEERIEKLEIDADNNLQYSKRNTLRISGVPDFETSKEPDAISKDILKYEPTDLKVVEIAQALNVEVSLEDIDRSHRIGVVNPNKPRDIIVKFKSYRARNVLYKARVDLKSKGYPRVFINESLTQIRSSLFYKARQLVKSRFLNGAWTYDGNIMIKDASHKIHRVSTLSELMQHKSGTPIPST